MRVAWVMKLKPGNEAIYKQKHDEIWPEMLANMRRDGICNFSIYRYGLVLFAYFERDRAPSLNQPPDPVTMCWWQMMAPYMDTNDDGTPWQAPVEEMFHTDCPPFQKRVCMPLPLLHGVIPILITPFDATGRIDEERVLDPACDNRLVRKPTGVLKVQQSRHQSRRRGRTSRNRREKPGPFPLEHLSVDQGGQLHQLMAQIDHIDQARAEQVILFGRKGAMLHQQT